MERHAGGLFAKDKDFVGEQQRLVQIVRDEYHGPAIAAQGLLERAHEPQLEAQIERMEGLIHEQHIRRIGERPGHGDPLRHAARKLKGTLVADRGKVEAHA